MTNHIYRIRSLHLMLEPDDGTAPAEFKDVVKVWDNHGRAVIGVYQDKPDEDPRGLVSHITTHDVGRILELLRRLSGGTIVGDP